MLRVEHYEDAGDFFGLRQEYRKRNLERVRREYGLPVPEIVSGRAIYRDEEGNEHPWHQSQRKEPEIYEVSDFWGGSPVLTPLDMSEDGVSIYKEAADLKKDLEGYMRSERVDFGVAANADLTLFDVSDDESVDRALQEYIKSHE